MDFIMGLVQAVLTVAAIGGLLLIVAALFPLIIGLGTSIDKRVNNQ